MVQMRLFGALLLIAPAKAFLASTPASPPLRPRHAMAPRPAAASADQAFDWWHQWYPLALERDLDSTVPTKVRARGDLGGGRRGHEGARAPRREGWD